MNNSTNYNKFPIVTPKGDVVLSSITNDSNIFYFLETVENYKARIYKYDENLNFICVNEVNEPIKKLYFNNEECIFIAIIKYENYKIYKLDLSYKIIGNIELNDYVDFGEMLDVSYNCLTNNYCVTYEKFMVEYNRCGDVVNIVKKVNGSYLFGTELAPMTIVGSSTVDQKKLSVRYSDCIPYVLKLTNKEIPVSVTFSLSFKNSLLKLFILFNSESKSYVRVYQVCFCELPCCPDKCNLGNQIICLERKLNCSTSNDDGDTGIENSISNIENSISKILNSESKKILKVLKNAKSTEEILEVNQSVVETINAIRELEEVLIRKLKVVKGTDGYDL